MLSPIEFEQHVAEFYLRCGFRVRLNERNGAFKVDVIADGQGNAIASGTSAPYPVRV
jgi:hypothetical protein